MRLVGRSLDLAADHVGNALFLVYAVVAVGSILVTVVVAVVTQAWALLLILLVPGLWIVMSRD